SNHRPAVTIARKTEIGRRVLTQQGEISGVRAIGHRQLAAAKRLRRSRAEADVPQVYFLGHACRRTEADNWAEVRLTEALRKFKLQDSAVGSESNLRWERGHKRLPHRGGYYHNRCKAPQLYLHRSAVNNRIEDVTTRFNNLQAPGLDIYSAND